MEVTERKAKEATVDETKEKEGVTRYEGWPDEAPILKRTTRVKKKDVITDQPHWIPVGKASVGKVTMRKNASDKVLPRKAAREIASGISFRSNDLAPGARCIELTKVCDFYEAKASGTYIDSPLCGRYLRSMAKEVRALSLALRDAENARRRRIRELETICEEWDEYFGANNQAAGLQCGLLDGAVPWTPAAVFRETQRVAKKNWALDAALAKQTAATALAANDGQIELEDHRRASREYAARQRAAFHSQIESLKIAHDEHLAKFSIDTAIMSQREQTKNCTNHKKEHTATLKNLEKMRAELAQTQKQLDTTQTTLQEQSQRADTAEAALRKAAFELAHVREMRRAAIDEALQAENKLRLARQVDAGQQCPDYGVGIIRFSALPKAGPNNTKILVHGVPSTISLAQLNTMLRLRLGLSFTAAQPRRATDVDGAKSFELTLPLPRDVHTLLELPGASLPPDPNDQTQHGYNNKIIMPSSFHNSRDASLGSRTSHRNPTQSTCCSATSRREPLRALDLTTPLNIIPATDDPMDYPSTRQHQTKPPVWAPTPPKITPPPAYTEKPDAVLERLSAIRPILRSTT
mmetsp:Transcript_16804/g.25272  ORF Transcript_16804/g.25272 Transcript_16804/m.25272 type:complete len:580 (+) Transcript_16804:49-1788(+)